MLTPFRIGVATLRDKAKDKLHPHMLRVQRATSLKDLGQDYAFYTPALIYMRVRLLGRDPHVQYARESGKEVIPMSIRFAKPIFHGLDLNGDRQWNHVLYAIEKEHWASFVSFMGTMAFIDRGLQLLTRIRTKEIAIADPLVLERAIVLPSELPMVPVTVFCLDSSKGCTWIEERGNALMDLPTLTTTAKVFDDTAAFARSLFAGDSNPYAAVDKVLAAEQAAPKPVVPSPPIPIETLAPQRRSALQDLVDQYNQKRGRL